MIKKRRLQAGLKSTRRQQKPTELPENKEPQPLKKVRLTMARHRIIKKDPVSHWRRKKNKGSTSKRKKISIPVMIEIPKGSRNKYEYDKNKKVIRFDRMLFSAVHYPSDYGFIPETLAEDGDPLDALVLVWEPTFPGCMIQATPVGLFKMWDEKGPDQKILCVPVLDPLWNHIQSLDDVPPHLLKEIEHFFAVYKDLEKKKTGVEGWADLDSALKIIEEASQRYQRQKIAISTGL